MRTLLLLGLLVSLLFPAQEPTLTATEKLFQESLTGVTLDGFYTSGKDMTVALPVPILWAGGKMFGAIRKNTAPQP